MKPITHVSFAVLCPASGLKEKHAMLQQHIQVLVQEPDYQNRVMVAAILKQDLSRMFGDQPPKEFYIYEHGAVSYVVMKNESGIEENERFVTIVALNERVVKAVLDMDRYQSVYEGLPKCRAVALMNATDFVLNKVSQMVSIVTEETYKQIVPMKTWVPAENAWDDCNAEVIPLQDPKPKLNLRDIPLTTRNNRNLLRNALVEHNDVLFKTYLDSKSAYSYEDWLINSQGIQLQALKDLEQIDALPDEQYVDALVTFKKAEVQAYHKKQVDEGKTDKHLFDWCVENFGEEFSQIGRKEALQEIGVYDTQSLDTDTQSPADSLIDAVETNEVQPEPATFVVQFDGTIVEDQRPLIGPVSPYAIEVLKALSKNGHAVFILTRREDQALEEVREFFKTQEFEPEGYLRKLGADDQIQYEEIKHPLNWISTQDVFWPDYFISHLTFGQELVQISGLKGTEPTLYWPSIVTQLRGLNYLSDEDLNLIQSSLVQDMQEN